MQVRGVPAVTVKNTIVGTVPLFTTSTTKTDSSHAKRELRGVELRYGASSMRGCRAYMEDAQLICPHLFAEAEEDGIVVKNSCGHARRRVMIPLPGHSMFAVFDGHGGTFASKYSARHFERVLRRQPDFIKYARSITEERVAAEEDQKKEEDTENTVKVEAGETEKDISTRPNIPQDVSVSTTPNDDAQQQHGKADVHGWFGLALLKSALRQACLDLDKELLLQVMAREDGRGRLIVSDVISSSSTASTSHPDDDDGGGGGDQEKFPCQKEEDVQSTKMVESRVEVSPNREWFRSNSANSTNTYGGIGHINENGYEAVLLSSSASSSIHCEQAVGPWTKESQEIEREKHSVQEGKKLDDDDDGLSTLDAYNGTTAIIVLFTPKHIVCANLGDCRAFLSRKSMHDDTCDALPLSHDHKPWHASERSRIIKAGGLVCREGRIDGELGVSRGLGDFTFKDRNVILRAGKTEFDVDFTDMDSKDGTEDNQADESSPASRSRSAFCCRRFLSWTRTKDRNTHKRKVKLVLRSDNSKIQKPDDQKVSPIPEIRVRQRDEFNDRFVVMACDGIWDVVSNEECMSMIADIYHKVQEEEAIQNKEDVVGRVCEILMDRCLRKGSMDNMTVLLVEIEPFCSGGSFSYGSGGNSCIRDDLKVNNDNEGEELMVTAAVIA